MAQRPGRGRSAAYGRPIDSVMRGRNTAVMLPANKSERPVVLPDGPPPGDRADHAAAHPLPEQFARFVAVGVVTTAVQYTVLWVGVSTLRAPAALASAAGYALGVVLGYALNYLLTFASSRPHAAAAPRYLAVFGIGWCINAGLMSLLVHRWGWNLWLAQVFATGIGLVWNFSGSRWWTFRHRHG